MSKQLKLRRGTTAQHSTFTGAEGEVTVDTTKDTLVVHDGATAGGKPLLTEANPSYTGTLTGGTGVVNLGSGQFYKDASGNVGIGVTPSAWNSSYVGFQVGSGVSLWGTKTGATGTYLSNNVVFDTTGNRKYLYTGTAAEYVQSGGIHSWYTAPSGTAGNAISFTQAMTLDASGRLGLGITSPSYTQQIQSATTSSGATPAFNLVINRQNSATEGLYLGMDGNADAVIAANNAALRFGTVVTGTYTERARIDSSGQMWTTNGAGAVARAYDCRAWVNFNGTGTVAIRASGNVSSITDNNVGDYTVNFTTAMPDANYSVNVVAASTSGAFGLVRQLNTGTTSAQRFLLTNTSAGAIDVDNINFSVFR